MMDGELVLQIEWVEKALLKFCAQLHYVVVTEQICHREALYVSKKPEALRVFLFT